MNDVLYPNMDDRRYKRVFPVYAGAFHCEGCKWWLKKGTLGECHRNPPLGIIDEPGSTKTGRPIWPRTGKDDFCGEFKYSYWRRQ